MMHDYYSRKKHNQYQSIWYQKDRFFCSCRRKRTRVSLRNGTKNGRPYLSPPYAWEKRITQCRRRGWNWDVFGDTITPTVKPLLHTRNRLFARSVYINWFAKKKLLDKLRNIMDSKIYVIPTDTCIGLGCRLDDQKWYELLCDIKGRNTSKPIAILVPTWEDLMYETKLSPAQVNFLRTYKFPFTIVCEVRDDFRDEYPLLDTYGYKTVWFRVAEACLPLETLSHIRSPLFLSSANKSGEKECHTVNEIERIFHDYLPILKIIPWRPGRQPASNVIAFKGNTNDLQYSRKNYPLPL